jgi:hypothetical protein
MRASEPQAGPEAREAASQEAQPRQGAEGRQSETARLGDSSASVAAQAAEQEPQRSRLLSL